MLTLPDYCLFFIPMNKVILTITLFFFASFAYAQQGYPQYHKRMSLAASGDSLYLAKDYKNAASAYLQAAKVSVEKGIVSDENNMYYNAACAYSLDKNADAAFKCLKQMVHFGNYTDLERITNDSDFTFIKKYNGWQEIMEKIKSNKDRAAKVKLIFDQRTTVTTENKETIFYPYTEFAKPFLENDSLPFISVNYKNFRIFFSAGSYANQHLDEIKSELDFAFGRSMSILNNSTYNRGIYIVLGNSPEEMKQLTGVYFRGGMASVGNDLVFFVCNINRRGQFKHELFHLLANEEWGITSSRLLNEGGAVYADNQCFYENPVYAIAAFMLNANKLFPVKSLISNFDEIANKQEGEIIAYLQSAAIFKYLYEKYGTEKMKLLWMEGFDKFEAIYGISLEQFERQWLDYIRSIAPPENIDWENILNNGCG